MYLEGDVRFVHLRALIFLCAILNSVVYSAFVNPALL